MKTKHFLVVLTVVLGTVALLCPTVYSAPPKDTIVIMREIDSNNYDPHRSAARGAAEILYMLGDTLVTLDPDMKTIRPGLAESWEIKDEGKTYVFHLRKDVKFHNGKSLTADDVVFSIKRWINPKPKKPLSWRAGPVKDVKALDAHTVAYELKNPDNELLYQLTLFCGTIIEEESVTKLGKDFGIKGFNGTGPYMWVSWTPRGDLVLKRNPDYTWGPSFYDNKGPVKAEKIVWRVVPEESTRVAAIQTGQVDITQYVPAWSLKQLQASPKVHVQQHVPYMWTYYAGFKITRPSVSDLKVRRALVAAVNQEEIAQNLFFGTVEPAHSYYHPDAIDFDPKVLELMPRYNPELANKLLDEAGWKMGQDKFRYKDGEKLTVLAYIFTNSLKWFEAIQGYLRKVGVDFKIQAFDATVAWAKLSTQEFDCWSMSYPYFSAGDALNLYFRSSNIPTPNRANWNDPWSDEMLDKGRSARDPKERYETYSKLQRKVHEACVWLPLYHLNMYVAATPRVKGVKTHGNYGCGLYKGLDLEIVK
jgi:peptide/nickel transport system substrate-binding protein